MSEKSGWQKFAELNRKLVGDRSANLDASSNFAEIHLTKIHLTVSEVYYISDVAELRLFQFSLF